ASVIFQAENGWKMPPEIFCRYMQSLPRNDDVRTLYPDGSIQGNPGGLVQPFRSAGLASFVQHRAYPGGGRGAGDSRRTQRELVAVRWGLILRPAANRRC